MYWYIHIFTISYNIHIRCEWESPDGSRPPRVTSSVCAREATRGRTRGRAIQRTRFGAQREATGQCRVQVSFAFIGAYMYLLIGKEKRSFSFAFIQREHFFWSKTMRF